MRDTPETDKWTGLRYSACNLAETSRDLERRLAECREALAKVAHACLFIEQAEKIAEKALTNTAPK